MEHREYLVSYEYGHGKAWAFVLAGSPEEIVAAEPALDVVAEPPAALTPSDLQTLRSTCFRLDGPLLQSVLQAHLLLAG